jgi:NH3-dependent NAD+ synthetase
LVGSRNRSEEVFGTYSVASRVVGCLPLAGLWKSEVMDLCHQVGVPPEVIASSRRADPNCGRPQELAEIGLELIDLYLRVQEKELPDAALAALTARQLQYLEHVRTQNRFKRGLPGRPPVWQRA